MPAQYIYNHATGSNVDLSGQVRAYTQQASANAEEGSVAISTFIVDDEPGGLDIKGHRTFFWKETSESSNYATILHGFVADRDISRGPFVVLNSRQWAVNVTDPNTLLGRPIMRGSDANRPAETDVARIQWLMTTGEMNLITDSTYISTASPVPMDAADYRDQTVLSIIDDCAQASGKNYFVLRNEFLSPPALGLFYDFAHSTAYASSVRLTNVLADVDSSTTFAVFTDDLKMNRDPSRVYSSVLLPFDGGEVFVTDDSIRLNFARRDVTAPSVNVKSTAKATARAQRYLRDIATEEDRITMSYLVPLAKVNRLREGHTFQVKFSHLPGYENWTWVRALKRTVKAESEEFYRVTIEATQGSGAAVSAATCSSAISSMQTYDSGLIGSIGGHNCSPQSVAPTTASANPAVVIGGIIAQNGQSQLADSTGSITGFTSLGAFPVGSASATAAGAGYKATSGGSPGNLTLSWNGSNCAEVLRGVAIYLPTSATSPVQSATLVGGGTTITLGATPTVGNILVLVRMVETSPFISVPSGFTQKVDGALASSAPGSAHIDICVRCVQPGDSAAVTVTDTSFTHAQWLSEWALT